MKWGDVAYKGALDNPDIQILGEPVNLPPSTLPTGRDEHSNQASLFAWAEQNLYRHPALKWMYAVPNGGFRHISTAAKLRREGVKAGVPDICLPAPRQGYHGLYLEMKAGHNKPTKHQLEYMAYLREAGYAVAVCYSAEEARHKIEWYLEQPVAQAPSQE